MSWREDFWRKVYDARPYLRLLDLFLIFALLLTGYSFVFGRSGTGGRVIAYLNLLMILVLGVAANALYWYAARRARDPEYMATVETE